MAGLNANTVALILYRLATILVGLALAYLGYRLFLTGLFEKAGDLKAAWGERQLELKQAAPGTVYAVLGAVVILVSLFKGLSVETSNGDGGGATVRIMALSDTAGRGFYGAGPGYDRRMIDIARRAVAGEKILPAERRQFLQWYQWYQVLWGPVDSSGHKASRDTTQRRPK